MFAGLQAAAGCPLKDAKENQQAQRRRKTAEKRRHREQENAAHVEALAPNPVGDPAADGEHDGIGNQVAGEHPGSLVAAGGE